MHRIDSSTATPDHRFTEGNPTIPVPATTVTADWLNSVQEELVKVVTEAGLTLDKGDTSQLWEAILKTIGVKAPLATKDRPGLVQPDGVTTYITTVEGVLAASPDMPWRPLENYGAPCLRVGSDGKLYLWKKASGPAVAGVGAKQPGAAGSEAYWLDYAASITPEISAGVPRGAVCPFCKVTFAGSDGRRPIFWGQTVADEGWVIADGGSDGAGGNVPDLRGRMIMGAGGSYAAGATGGAATHKHSVTGTVGATTLTEAQLASHRHAILTTTGGVNGWEYNPFGRGFTTGTNGSSIQSTGGSKSHTHALTASSGAAASLPPYYALAYIIRIT